MGILGNVYTSVYVLFKRNLFLDEVTVIGYVAGRHEKAWRLKGEKGETYFEYQGLRVTLKNQPVFQCINQYK